MPSKGYALYKVEKKLFLIPVAYEFADTKFVGFDQSGTIYKIGRLNDAQKAWLKKNNPIQDSKVRDYIFAEDYFAYKVPLSQIPKGKPYTQLPGGGGVYKETRKYNYLPDLFKNETFLRALGNHGSFLENYNSVKKIVKEAVEDFILKKKLKFQA